MHRRLRYLILVVSLLAATVSISIIVSAAVRYNRDAGLFDILEPDRGK